MDIFPLQYLRLLVTRTMVDASKSAASWEMKLTVPALITMSPWAMEVSAIVSKYMFAGKNMLSSS